jgi:hypothetical protein
MCKVSDVISNYCAAPVNVIVSGRCTGKTYTVLKMMIDSYLDTGKTGVYTVRDRKEFKYAKHVFSDTFDLYIIEKTNNKYNSICYTDTKFYLCKIKKDKVVKIDKNYFCQLLPINAVKIVSSAVNVSPDIGYKCAKNAGIVVYDMSSPCFALEREVDRFFALINYTTNAAQVFINTNFKDWAKDFTDKFNVDISKIHAGNTYISDDITIFVGG